MTSTRTISVLLAEDHTVVRQGLRALLGGDATFRMAGEAQNGREAVALARNLRPDVILMDIAMPALNGLEAARQILAADPAARVIMLSAYSDDEYVARASAIGAAGFLEKQTSAEILFKAIREVAAGRNYYSPLLARRQKARNEMARNRNGVPTARSHRLTPREAEVLQLIAEGRANKQVAAELGISIKTVEKHRQHVMDKLNIHETAGLTRYAIAAGVIEGGVKLSDV